MQNILDPDMRGEVEEYIREKGIDLKLKQGAKSIIGQKEVKGVELISGEKIKTEMVIISGGIAPNVELAQKAGLHIGQYGLKVNEYLQTSNPDIYAAGAKPLSLAAESVFQQLYVKKKRTPEKKTKKSVKNKVSRRVRREKKND